MKTLGIFGMSGFAREVGDIAAEIGYRPVYIGRDEAECAAWPFGGDIVAETGILGDEWCYAIGIGNGGLRRKVAEKHAARHFPALIHPSATFGRRQREIVEAFPGAVICAGVRITCNSTIGKFFVANLNVTIGHDCTIGDFVTISPGANVSGNVQLDDGCYIGTGAAVNQGTPEAKLVIGARTMIGSGAVVVKACEPDAVYVGAPAKRIK